MRAAGSALVALGTLAVLASAAQEPAVSGLSPEPTPSSATSLTPVPTPPALARGRAEPPASARGASLADVVRLSKEARKGQPPKKSLGTITNDNVKKGGAPTTTPTPASKFPQSRAASGRPPAKDSEAPAPTPWVPRDDKGRTEQDWRGLVTHQNALVQNGEARVRDLETKSKQLENDFYAMSDGNRRDAVVKPAWDKARDDLAKARVELESARKGLEDLSEEGRRSNAPPGWLR